MCVLDCDKFSPAATTIMLMFLVFESLLFGLFTAIMCLTQLCAIASDHTVCVLHVNHQSHFHILVFATSSTHQTRLIIVDDSKKDQT